MDEAVGIQAPTPNDAELVIRCCKNDAQAWQFLIAKYRRLAFAIALRHLSRGEAEDVVQETFLALHLAIQKNRPPLNLAGWVVKTTKDEVKSFLRKNSAQKRSYRFDATSIFTSTPTISTAFGASVASHVKEAGMAEVLWEIIDTLPRTHRIILKAMLTNEDVTDRELTKRAGLKNTHSVAVQRNKAIANLKNKLLLH